MELCDEHQEVIAYSTGQWGKSKCPACKEIADMQSEISNYQDEVNTLEQKLDEARGEIEELQKTAAEE